MKRFFQALLVFFMPLFIGIGALTFLYPSDVENFFSIFINQFSFPQTFLGKLNLVKKTPASTSPGPSPEERGAPLLPGYPPLLRFLNSEVFTEICAGELDPVQAGAIFEGCSSCPGYLFADGKSVSGSFTRQFEARGPLTLRETRTAAEEAIVFMKGCTGEGIGILLERGRNGWVRKNAFEGLFFDKDPLLFYSNDGYIRFVGKQTLIVKKQMQISLVSLTFAQKDGRADVRTLFSFSTPAGLIKSCSTAGVKVVVGEPRKISDEFFQLPLEIASCLPASKHHPLEGAHMLSFGFNEENFVPKKETEEFLTRFRRRMTLPKRDELN